MPRLIAVQLEVNHHTHNAIAWYAYTDAESPAPPPEPDLVEAAGRTTMRTAIAHDPSDWEEVPNDLSNAAGLRRYYAGGVE